MKLSIEDIIKSTGGYLLVGNKKTFVDEIVIDSRMASEKNMFIAIKGDSQDGHKYIDSAYENGCRKFLVSDKSMVEKYMLNNRSSIETKKDSKQDELATSTEDEINSKDLVSIVFVENTEVAMGDIAKYYREKFDIPFIGVTGSVGKTTTRDMIYSVINEKYNTLKNEKNFNNQFGVPMTLFKLNNEHECAIIEMGMCGFGEIEYLVNIVNPQMSVISNIGSSHIELLGSRKGIFEAKMEIASKFDAGNTLIVNGDDDFLSTVFNEKDDKEKYPYEILSFGKSKGNTIQLIDFKTIENEKTIFEVYFDKDFLKDVSDVKEVCDCSFENKSYTFEIPTVGEHNVYNAMSAILVGMKLCMNFNDIQEGLYNFSPTKDRQDIVKRNGYTIINDVYNASPDSMIASLKVLNLYDNRKVCIFGDCLEMGQFAEQGHRQVGIEAKKDSDIIITTGSAAKYIGTEAVEKGMDENFVYHFETKEELISSLDTIIKKDDVVLIKASRGMKFEDIVKYIEEDLK